MGNDTPRAAKPQRLGLTLKQLEQRREVLGGTDAAAILGVSAYRTPHDVYADKTGEARPPDDLSEPARWGLLLEPVVRERYEDVTGRKVQVPKRLIRHPDRPWQGGHLDGRTRGGEARVYEGKTARTDRGWGEPGTDDIPPAYKAQVWHYMAVTGLRVADVAVLIGGSDFRIYTVEWDPSIEDLTAEEYDFWHGHVLPRIPPEYDGSEAASRFLRARHPAEDPGSELVALPHQYGILDALLEAQRRRKAWAQQEERLKQAIMDAMGDAAVLHSPQLKATWTTPKAGRMDWKTYAASLEKAMREQYAIPPEHLETLKGLYTAEPVRTFRVYPRQQLEEGEHE